MKRLVLLSLTLLVNCASKPPPSSPEIPRVITDFWMPTAEYDKKCVECHGTKNEHTVVDKKGNPGLMEVRYKFGTDGGESHVLVERLEPLNRMQQETLQHHLKCLCNDFRKHTLSKSCP